MRPVSEMSLMLAWRELQQCFEVFYHLSIQLLIQLPCWRRRAEGGQHRPLVGTILILVRVGINKRLIRNAMGDQLGIFSGVS